MLTGIMPSRLMIDELSLRKAEIFRLFSGLGVDFTGRGRIDTLAIINRGLGILHKDVIVRMP